MYVRLFVVFQDGQNDVRDHLFQFFEESLGFVFVAFYLPQFLLPTSCQFCTLEQLFVNEVDEFEARLCRVERRTFPANVVTTDEGFDDGSSGTWPADSILLQGISEFFVFHSLACRFHSSQQSGICVWFGWCSPFLGKRGDVRTAFAFRENGKCVRFCFFLRCFNFLLENDFPAFFDDYLTCRAEEDLLVVGGLHFAHHSCRLELTFVVESCDKGS